MCNEEGVPIECVVLLVKLGLVALVLYEHLCGSIVGITFQKQALCFVLRQIEAVGPARFRQREVADVLIAGFFKLFELMLYRVYFGIGILPELLNFYWAMVGELGRLADSQPPS